MMTMASFGLKQCQAMGAQCSEITITNKGNRVEKKSLITYHIHSVKGENLPLKKKEEIIVT